MRKSQLQLKGFVRNYEGEEGYNEVIKEGMNKGRRISNVFEESDKLGKGFHLVV